MKQAFLTSLHNNMLVRTRIAPSPTGFFHIGTARTALFNFLFAKKHDGQFILRIEDTDKERNTKESEQDIFAQMVWLGYEYDEKYVQSEHLDEHTKLLKRLVDSGRAYVSKEQAKDGSGRVVEVVRLKNPGKVITFDDAVRGPISFDTTELKDFVIARSIDDPLYHFAVVCDDGSAGITHVIRGEEHISNTPRQILIQEALDLPRPIYGHIPLILMPDRSKMSKRKHKTAVKDYREKGYIPAAMNNFLALLGWSAGEGDRELFSLSELIDEFDLARVHKSGAIFNEEKLRWFNREYLVRLPEDEFTTEAYARLKDSLASRVSWNEERARALIPILRERVALWEEIGELSEAGEFDYYFSPPQPEKVRIHDKKSTPEIALQHLRAVSVLLKDLTVWSAEDVKEAIWSYSEEQGRGAVLWPLRYTLSGRDKSPDPFTLAAILGKEETLSRIHDACAILEK